MEAGVVQHLLCSAQLQAEGMHRGRLQNEQEVKDVVLLGTLTFIDTARPNG